MPQSGGRSGCTAVKPGLHTVGLLCCGPRRLLVALLQEGTRTLYVS